MATKKPNESEEVKAVEKKEDDRVTLMVPYIEGQDPEVTVIVNYKVTKFRKGVTVRVKPEVAEALANSNQQMMAAYENQKKFEKQVMEI